MRTQDQASRRGARGLTRKVSADDSASIFPAESPAYPALASAVSSSWKETRRAFGELRREWFDIAGLEQPGTARAARHATGDVRAGRKAERLSPRQEALLN